MNPAENFLRGKFGQRESGDDVRPWRALPEYLLADAEKCAVASGVSLREFIIRSVQAECDRVRKRKQKQTPLKFKHGQVRRDRDEKTV